jgi:cytochrome b561
MLRNSREGYGGVARALHWLSVAAALLTFTLSDEDDHIVSGAVFAGLMLTRLTWRLASIDPLAETSLPNWQVWVAKSVHFAIYAAALASAVAGLFILDAAGKDLSWRVHVGLANGLLLLVILHIVAAAWRFVMDQPGGRQR